MDKSSLIKSISGYRIAAEFIESERISRLQNLSSSESLKIFIDLCNYNEQTIHNESEELEQIKLKYLVKRKIIFEKLSKGFTINDNAV